MKASRDRTEQFMYTGQSSSPGPSSGRSQPLPIPLTPTHSPCFLAPRFTHAKSSARAPCRASSPIQIPPSTEPRAQTRIGKAREPQWVGEARAR